MRRLSEPLALARTVKQLGMHDYDAMRLAHQLVLETVRRQNFIDAYIDNALRPATTEEHTLGVQAFLRLYVYQTRVAKSWTQADIHEAENIAKLARSILGWKTLQPVEPILGTLLTQSPTVVLENTTDEQRVGLQTFHPTWFVGYCFKLFGRKETIVLLEANSRPPPTYMRLNTLKAKENETLDRLAQDGIQAEKVDKLKHAYKILNAKQPATRTQSFKEGLFYVQDKASCFTAEAANPQPGMTVLDVCAAPGAKTTYLAQLMQNRGTILSVDYSKRRMATWKNEVKHLGVEIAEPITTDARSPLPFTVEADVLVLDPPCTSTGTFGKLPSAKWRLTRRSIDRMAEIQWQMLNNCAEHVKSGGSLIYSTCSVTVEENEVLIERFLKWHPEFTLTEINPRIGSTGLRGLQECQRFYPHVHQCNGSFIAKLAKTRV